MINTASPNDDAPQIYYGHRVLDSDEKPPFGPDAHDAISAAALREFLRQNHARTALSISDITGPVVPGAFALTFDDGFADFAEIVVPIVEEFQVPVALFLTSGLVNGELALYERVLAGLISAAPDRIKLNGKSIDLSNANAKEAAYQRLRLSAKNAFSKRKMLLEKLSSATGISPSAVKLPKALTASDVRTLASHPLVTLGAHSVSHKALARSTPWAAWAEIADSRKVLEKISGKPVLHFAHPYGSHTALTRRMVAAAGYRSGFGTAPRSLEVSDTKRPWALPRRDIASLVT